ncbi:glycosyltransferase family 2 protein [Faecalibaculum rodentium]|uniref:glycosyltransferase family 2 protein n=1 Tax=Faecalibaculum rodentium TaxID=1702221 RepID=UPI0025B74B53|nr:glycosyltransferase family A protein [Faecalibaculum rodentium]
MDATIVIPTKNGGELFEKVLDIIHRQETDYTYEVVCVDSGSHDNTVKVIRKYGCILKQIPKEEFGHGKTRNLGASLGTGEYILFLTQDALPADTHWLQNFLDGMKSDPEIVGGFGIHYPYPDCNLLDKRDLEMHFQGFGKSNTIYQLTDHERYKRDEGYRHLLAFFSDNNSCVKRDVFEKYPYEDVNFAEDQIWARQMIEKGYKKLYCPAAAVFHSHNYPLETYRMRYYDEYKGLLGLHGYVMAHSWKEAVKLFLALTRRDIRYLRTLDLTEAERKKWNSYAVKRNWYRVTSALRAGKYPNLSDSEKEKMDRKYSQQLQQRSE